jgi:ABC-type transport system involved in multi-copper enzyme maturation permease subunit
LLPVLGILLITSEWAQRTGLVTFTQEPNRGRVVVAKTLGALLVGVAAVALLLAVAGAGNVLGAQLQDGVGGWNAGGGRGFVYVLILQVSAIIQGLAFGMLLMNSAAAIVCYFVIPIGFNIVFSTVPALTGVAPWIDLGTAQEPLFDFNKVMSGMEWAQLAVTSSIWVGLLFALGVVRLLRSEVRSA